MATSWRIDPTNPGEVLACCGIAHLAWRSDPATSTGFHEDSFRLLGDIDPLALLSPLKLASADDGLSLSGVLLDWWSPWGLNQSLKTWAGQQSEMTVHRSLVAATEASSPADWLTHSAPAAGRLNVDVLGHWNALGIGWSINEHGHVQMLCRPWVELLASVGLQVFPMPGSRGGGFNYRLWHPAPLPSAIAAFAGYGPDIYAGPAFKAATGKAGSNTILQAGRPA
jgi:CRISPR-associated protein Csx14